MGKVRQVGLIALALATAVVARDHKQQTIPYRNTAPGVAFVGSKTCEGAGCHEELCRNYYQTPHGSSMGPANAPSELAKVPDRVVVYDQKVDRYYQVARIGSDLFQTQYQLDASGSKIYTSAQKLEYKIGGHSTGNIYIIRWGQDLFQAPLSYYLRLKGWDLAPGYQAAPRPFNRPIALCPYCHNGQPQEVPNRAGVYRDPPFRFMEYGISCEVCHGPGELHLQEFGKHPKRKYGKPDPTIVNPARLSPRLACGEPGWRTSLILKTPPTMTGWR